MGQALMEIGPFSWGGNEEQMWRGSWGADSCRDRGLGLHEGTCDCGYRNCLKPQSWGSVWAWEAKLPPLTLDFLISLSLMEPVKQEACGGRERGWGGARPPLPWLLTLLCVQSRFCFSTQSCTPVPHVSSGGCPEKLPHKGYQQPRAGWEAIAHPQTRLQHFLCHQTAPNLWSDGVALLTHSPAHSTAQFLEASSAGETGGSLT